MENQVTGYPIELFYLTALIGTLLVLYRPRWAFLFAVLCLSVRHYHMSVYTRTPLLGEFLNLNDLFLWIGVLALVRVTGQGQRIWAPKILLAIIAILIIGDFEALFRYGFSYIVMKSLWGPWSFPLLMFVAVNLVRNERDARLFFWTLFLGSVGAAVQHLFFLQTQIIDNKELFITGGLRTISFIFSGGMFLVISAFFVDIRKVLLRLYLVVFWFIGLSLIAVSYILSFTRTVWVGALMATVALFLVLYREQGQMKQRFAYGVILLAITLAIFRLTSVEILSHVDVAESIDERADFVRHVDSFEDAYESRETGMETELELWKEGSIIWGVGASYPPSLLEASIDATGAIHHVAFSGYLAHFGLIGLVIYGLLLPFLTIRVAKRYYVQHSLEFGGIIAITAMALAFFDFFTLLSSNTYLLPIGHVQGLIYGAMWGLTRNLAVNSSKHSTNNIMLPHLNSNHQWLAGPAGR
jgi:hypothetical protein